MLERAGVWLFLWGEEIIVDIQNYNLRHINRIVQTPKLQTKSKFTSFYGNPKANKRKEAWNLLKFLATLNPTPWICIGYFNEVLIQSEKWGGRGRLNRQMREFQKALEHCELFDMGYKGPKFTWNNCQESQTFVKERLDRGVVNRDWYELY